MRARIRVITSKEPVDETAHLNNRQLLACSYCSMAGNDLGDLIFFFHDVPQFIELLEQIHYFLATDMHISGQAINYNSAL